MSLPAFQVGQVWASRCDDRVQIVAIDLYEPYSVQQSIGGVVRGPDSTWLAAYAPTGRFDAKSESSHDLVYLVKEAP